MKPKDWLLKNGHIKEITRGRMSRENIALIEEAVKSGVVIDGYAINKPVIKSDKPKSDTGPSVEKVSINANRIADVPDETRPESQWEAHTYVDGVKRKVGMRTVCNICNNSLTYCYCRTPLVTVDTDTAKMVTFTVRTTPLPNRLY